MSDAASVTLNLHTLEQDLQTRLHAEPLQAQPLQIRCVFKEGILIVLVQHGAPAIPYPRRAFRTIRNFLHEEDVLTHYQVLMYLRVEGTNQPYAFHTLTEQSKPATDEGEDLSLPPLMPTPSAPQASTNTVLQQQDIGEDPAFTDNGEVYEEDDAIESFDSELEDIEDRVADDDEPTEIEDSLDEDDDYREPEDDDENIGFEGFTSADGDLDDFSESVEEGGDRRLSKATLIFAAGLAIAFAASAFYVLTRPCVVDRCETMSRATKLSDQSLKIFQNNPSGQEILAAQGQLQEAIKKLESIPFWSPRYTEAQTQLKDYRGLYISLNGVINALYKASDASQMSQKPPFDTAKWSKISEQWQAAIAGLKAVPPQDYFYPFAQSKIDAYQRSFNAIDQRLAQEKGAVDILTQAKEDAKIAQVQQGVAQSLDSWEEAYLSWADAIQKLELIPESTTSYKEAQELIATYAPQMASSQENQNKESLAQSVYNQGNRIAELAQAAEVKEEWDKALFHWKQAIKYMQQVPSDSYQATLAQSAIARFNQSLQESQVQLQLYTRLKKAEADLQKTCAGKPNICTFTLNAKNIDVRLTAAYVNNVQKTAVQASATNNSDAKIRLLDHIATLEQALEIISRNTNIPVQVYDVNGVLLVDYKP